MIWMATEIDTRSIYVMTASVTANAVTTCRARVGGEVMAREYTASTQWKTGADGQPACKRVVTAPALPAVPASFWPLATAARTDCMQSADVLGFANWTDLPWNRAPSGS